jgi:arginyl-tRNA synthetase
LASPERFRLTLPAHPSSLEPEPTTEVSPATSGPVSRTASPEPTSPGRLGAAPARPGQPGPSAEPAESAPDTGPVPFPGADSPPSLTARHFTNSGPESEVSRIRSDEQVPPSDAKLQWQEAAGPEGPDTMAVFAIGPAGARIGGYGGSPPREMTADIAAAVAFAGRDAVTFTLARAIPGKPLRVDPEIIARHVLGNPAYAVRYAHARAASGVRWAAASAAGPPHTFADQGETAWPTSVAGTGAPPLPIAGTGAPPLPVGGTGGPPLPFAGAGGPDTLAVFAIGPASTGIGGYGGSPPREKTVLSLLDALSWLPERVATAARRGRPDEFARYLEDLASVTVDILSSTSHPGSAGPGWAAAPGSDRLTLAKAARTGLAAGLGLLGVAAPERL